MGFFYIKYFYYLCNVVSDRLKDIVFKKLYKELSKVEIIPYKDSVYFIDRDNKYWYFEYEKSNKLWWRYDFFINFFVLRVIGLVYVATTESSCGSPRSARRST